MPPEIIERPDLGSRLNFVTVYDSSTSVVPPPSHVSIIGPSGEQFVLSLTDALRGVDSQFDPTQDEVGTISGMYIVTVNTFIGSGPGRATYHVYHSNTGANVGHFIELKVSSTKFEHSIHSLYTVPFTWNSHLGSFSSHKSFSSPRVSAHSSAEEDAENPDLARYYVPEGAPPPPQPGVDTAPIAITNAPTATSLDGFTARGLWFGADGDSDNLVRFYYVDGQSTELDPSTIPGVSISSQQNVGRTPTGEFSQFITGNTYTGTTYWAYAENDLGESFGSPIYVPPVQLTASSTPYTVETLPATPGDDPSTEWLMNAQYNPFGFGVNGGFPAELDDSRFVHALASEYTAETDLRSLPSATITPAGNPRNWPNVDTRVNVKQQSLLADNLTPATPYVFQIIGEYTNATEYFGQVLQFVTTTDINTTVAEDDVIATTSATGISETTATLGGGYSPGTVHGDELEAVYFVYVEGPASGETDLRNIAGNVQTVNRNPPTGNGGAFNQTVTNLDAGTLYTYQAFGERTSNQAWETMGTPVQFATNPELPQVTADEDAETLGHALDSGDPSTTVDLFGSVSPAAAGGQQFTDSEYVYVAGTFTGTTDLSLEAGAVTVNHGNPSTTTTNAETVTGLTPGTTYSFQFTGLGGPGTDRGLVQQFTTATSPATTFAEDDQVFTLSATSVSNTEATINGAYDAGTVHGDELEAVYFVYAPGNLAAETDLRNSPGSVTTADLSPAVSFSQALTGLTPGTTYSFQSFGKRTSNQTWETMGGVSTFVTTTSTGVQPLATTATDIDEDSATLNAVLSNTNQYATDIDYHFEYSSEYDLASGQLFNATATATQSVNLAANDYADVSAGTGNVLTSLTTYAYRLVIE